MTLQCIQQPHPHLNANLENGVLTLALNRAETIKCALWRTLSMACPST
ncbi:HSP20 family molecular chaperone IbpA [Acinetobacter baylyi]|uniref:HSP20 family molecular chaperone IbpA n=1 Tax=Acinetobacter baylyi TaxID=202950 RepID=A0ABU0V072_ACIBI|nr:HSP20 family molecular chaperone IbpA [Acinetobacter baylyi]